MTCHTFAVDQIVTAHALGAPEGPYRIVRAIAVGEQQPTISGQEHCGRSRTDRPRKRAQSGRAARSQGAQANRAIGAKVIKSIFAHQRGDICSVYELPCGAGLPHPGGSSIRHSSADAPAAAALPIAGQPRPMASTRRSWLRSHLRHAPTKAEDTKCKITPIRVRDLLTRSFGLFYWSLSRYSYSFIRFCTGAVLVPHGAQKVLYVPVNQFAGNIAAQGFPAPVLLAYLTYFTELVAAGVSGPRSVHAGRRAHDLDRDGGNHYEL